MPVPELPSDLKSVVMEDWFQALWLRMHKRKYRCVVDHLGLCFDTTPAYESWENTWGYEDDEIGVGAMVVEQYETRQWVLEQDGDVGWDQVIHLHLQLAKKPLSWFFHTSNSITLYRMK